MKYILHLFIISFFSLTVFSCAKKSDSSSAASSGLFITVGTSGALLTSSDGTTWNAQTSGTSNYLRGVAYDGSTTLVVVGNAGTILTSLDGATWTSRTSGISNDLNDVSFNSSGTFTAVGDNGTLIKSSDGIT